MTSRYLGALLALPLVGLCGLSTAQADKIYRTTEPDGTVVFTDQPAPDAVIVEPGPISVISTDTPPSTLPTARNPGTHDDSSMPDASAPGSRAAAAALDAIETGGSPATDVEPNTAVASPDNASTDDASARIDSVVIASPPADATLLDPTGPLIVEIGTEPGSLATSGLVAELLFDGDIVASGASSQLVAPELLRGTHEIQVRLVNGKGRVIARSGTQALHVRRTTVNSGGGN